MQRLKRKPLRMQLVSIFENLTGSVDKLLRRTDQWQAWQMMLALTGALALVLLLLSACSPRIVRPPLPPQAEARVIPTFDGKTWRDVLYYVVELRETCMSSEADKAAIRYVYRVPAK